MAEDTWQLTTLNVNGLRAATRKGFAEFRDGCGADVVLLQETRMQDVQLKAAHRPPEGWTGAWAQAEKKGYSGACAWSRLPVTATTTDCGIELARVEGRWAQIETPQATLVSLYLPSGSSGEARQAIKDDFSEQLLAHMDTLLESGAPVAVCGDYNVAHTELDIWEWKRNAKNSGFLPHERAWFSRLLDRGWVDLWRRFHPEERGYSWWSNRGQARAKDRGWRIDYVLCSPALAERATACWIQGQEPAVSDHCAVHATFARV